MIKTKDYYIWYDNHMINIIQEFSLTKQLCMNF